MTVTRRGFVGALAAAGAGALAWLVGLLPARRPRPVLAVNESSYELSVIGYEQEPWEHSTLLPGDAREVDPALECLVYDDELVYSEHLLDDVRVYRDRLNPPGGFSGNTMRT